MKIKLSEKQFREVLLVAMVYSWIRGGLADRNGEDFKKYEELENYLLEIAKNSDLTNLVEEFHGGLVPADELSNLVEKIIEEYDDDTFWNELVVRLGKRDFWRTVDSEEEKEIRKKDWLPERVRGFYEKYEKEFEERGLDRIEIV